MQSTGSCSIVYLVNFASLSDTSRAPRPWRACILELPLSCYVALMTRYVGPVSTHAPTDYHPPGIPEDSLDWCHLVSNVDYADLLSFLSANADTIGARLENIRTPAEGSTVTYIALTAAQRTAALAAGAAAAPSDGKCYAQCFNKVPGATWEPT